MQSSATHNSIIRDIEKRARARPCTFDDLAGLDRELKERVTTLRRERETRRARETIEPETRELRKAIEVARSAIRHAMTEHESTRRDVGWLAEMVRRGHVHEAVKEHAKLQMPAMFPDLNCDFVGTAVRKQHSREQWLVAVLVVAAGIILMIVTLVELVKRSTPNSP